MSREVIYLSSGYEGSITYTRDGFTVFRGRVKMSGILRIDKVGTDIHEIGVKRRFDRQVKMEWKNA